MRERRDGVQLARPTAQQFLPLLYCVSFIQGEAGSFELIHIDPFLEGGGRGLSVGCPQSIRSLQTIEWEKNPTPSTNPFVN